LALPSHDNPDAPLSPALYVVATPIGNLEDITLRALRILRSADLIACEDTRHTQKLLNHFEIKTPTQSYHEHNEAARAQELVAKMNAGARIALVSDAGMPGVSDPGERVIRAALDRGLKVVVVPGPSALISALVASGLPTDSFRFLGFLPPRSGERRTALEGLRDSPETLIFYEAPHRISEMLADLEQTFGKERHIALARELTKIHEEFLRGSITEVAGELRTRGAIKGEITLIVEGSRTEGPARAAPSTVVDRIRELMGANALDEKAALKHAAKEFGLSRSAAYREWQRGKKAEGRR
jgi:16S rRNA (cytidine1402-2'-O)-methyltransferase